MCACSASGTSAPHTRPVPWPAKPANAVAQSGRGAHNDRTPSPQPHAQPAQAQQQRRTPWRAVGGPLPFPPPQKESTCKSPPQLTATPTPRCGRDGVPCGMGLPTTCTELGPPEMRAADAPPRCKTKIRHTRARSLKHTQHPTQLVNLGAFTTFVLTIVSPTGPTLANMWRIWPNLGRIERTPSNNWPISGNSGRVWRRIGRFRPESAQFWAKSANLGRRCAKYCLPRQVSDNCWATAAVAKGNFRECVASNISASFA